jgi:hypothetical protein
MVFGLGQLARHRQAWLSTARTFLPSTAQEPILRILYDPVMLSGGCFLFCVEPGDGKTRFIDCGINPPQAS